MPAELPTIIDNLRSWLIGQGFQEEQFRFDPAVFGNWWIVLARPPCRIQIIRDRSLWSIDIRGDGLSAWYDIDLWRACVENSEATTRGEPLEDRVAFLRASLLAIETALRSPVETERCLQQKGAARARRILGD